MGMKHARKRNTLVDKLVVRYLYNILWHIVYPYVLWGSMVTKAHTSGAEAGVCKKQMRQVLCILALVCCVSILAFGLFFFVPSLNVFWFLMPLYCVLLCVCVCAVNPISQDSNVAVTHCATQRKDKIHTEKAPTTSQ